MATTRRPGSIALDAGSELADSLEAHMLAREGNQEGARRKLARDFSEGTVGNPTLLRACLDQRPPQELDTLTRHIEGMVGTPARDAEELYLLAATASFCGLPDSAVRAARRMVAENYCQSIIEPRSDACRGCVPGRVSA